MENGTALEWGNINISFGSPYQEGTLILPKFNTDSSYYMLYIAGNLTGDPSGSIGVRVNLAEIDMTLNNGLGKVVLKDQVLISDSLDYGKMTACRHANGRDWWIIVPRREEGSFPGSYMTRQVSMILVNSLFPIFTIQKGSGQCRFSPDGTHMLL